MRTDVPITPELIDHPHAVQTQNRQQRQDDEVEHDDRPIEAIERIEIADVVAPVTQDRIVHYSELLFDLFGIGQDLQEKRDDVHKNELE